MSQGSKISWHQLSVHQGNPQTSRSLASSSASFSCDVASMSQNRFKTLPPASVDSSALTTSRFKPSANASRGCQVIYGLPLKDLQGHLP